MFAARAGRLALTMAIPTPLPEKTKGISKGGSLSFNLSQQRFWRIVRKHRLIGTVMSGL